MQLAEINEIVSALLEIGPAYHRIILDKIEKKSTHITKSQIFILLALAGHPFLNMTQIAAYIASSKEQATRAVAPLVEMGYVLREHDTHNRKVVLISLTTKGNRFIHEMKSQLQQALEKNLQILSKEEQIEFISSLSFILYVLEKITVEK